MTRQIIDTVPFWWLIILFILVFLVLAYVSACISSLFLADRASDDLRKLANTLIGILSGGFSILLAFVIINTWNYQLESRAATSKEADYLSLLLHDIAVFPAEEQAKIREATRHYTVAVRVDEWKTMRKGDSSPKAWDAINELYTAIQSVVPKTDQEKVYYTRITNNLNNLLKARRERLNNVASVIPEPLRVALLVGSILLVVILGSVRGEKNIFNIMPLMFFAIILGFNLGLALSFDYPYSGDIAISNLPFYSGSLAEFSDT